MTTGVEISAASFWFSVISLFLAGISYAVLATWHIGRVESRVLDALTTRTESLRKEVEADLNARDAIASRARHDLAGQTDRTFMDMRQSLKEMNDRHFNLDREAIRKVDLSALETRLTATLTAHETRITNQITKIEQRFDKLSEQLDKN